jgi:hypothetical protein
MNGAVMIKVLPSNKHFDIASVSYVSSILQHCKAEQETANYNHLLLFLIFKFNLSISNEFANLFHPVTIAPSVATVVTDVFQKNWIMNAKEIS